jgi:hypothetical protein
VTLEIRQTVLQPVLTGQRGHHTRHSTRTDLTIDELVFQQQVFGQ